MATKQADLEFSDPKKVPAGPVECLGLTFEHDEARRAHFLSLLRERLQDPEFRKIPGFPFGNDDAILELSDPPYYTACPNPFLSALIEHHTSRSKKPREYQRLPLTEDVSASKADVVYTAHSYHTKVPPQAIASYIQHFTDPGDVVLDFFSGSGMTALACRLADDADSVRRRRRGDPAVDHQARLPICVDLSPAATFIASVYAFSARFSRIRQGG